VSDTGTAPAFTTRSYSDCEASRLNKEGRELGRL